MNGPGTAPALRSATGTCLAYGMPAPAPSMTCTLGRDHRVGAASGCPACLRLTAACTARPCSARRGVRCEVPRGQAWGSGHGSRCRGGLARAESGGHERGSGRSDRVPVPPGLRRGAPRAVVRGRPAPGPGDHRERRAGMWVTPAKIRATRLTEPSTRSPEARAARNLPR